MDVIDLQAQEYVSLLLKNKILDRESGLGSERLEDRDNINRTHGLYILVTPGKQWHTLSQGSAMNLSPYKPI
ncbi:hypothetical protein BABINDRAFT_160540, partial [Babjeviella inositovora NRRL Y-12698]